MTGPPPPPANPAELEPAAALQLLAAALRRLHEEDGAPSTRVVARMAERRGLGLSHTSVHNLLTGSVVPSWDVLRRVVTVLDGDPEQFRALWLAARPPALMRGGVRMPGPGREWRVAANLERDGMHCVAELTEEAGLVSRIGGLERWQALAIVAILHPPF